MSLDGAGRKRMRFNQLVQKIRDHGKQGIGKEQLVLSFHRQTGLNTETILDMLEVLQKTKEIKIDYGKVVFLASEYV